jgi:hypothetical protein
VSEFKPPRRAPSNRGHLERLVDQYARAHGLAIDRTRRWLSMMALIGALERVRLDDGPRFLIKGGVSIELRLGLRARTTKDIDLVFRGAPRELVNALEDAFEPAHSGFSFRRKGEVENIRDTDSQRLAVQVSFAGRDWQTLQVEVGPPEADEVELVAVAISIEDFKIDGPRQVACLSLRYQVAQKLHAVTERPEGRENQRFWDLIDLILLRALIEDLRPVRDACREIFATRGTHPWPPRLDVPESWVEPFARLAAELEFPIADVYGAGEELRDLIASIDAGMPIRRPRVGQTWRRADGIRVHIRDLRPETADVSEFDPETGTTSGNAINPADFDEMVLIDDPPRPNWLIVVEATYGGPVSDALRRIGTIEAAGNEIVSEALASTVTVRVVAADEATARQLAHGGLPGPVNIIAVTKA